MQFFAGFSNIRGVLWFCWNSSKLFDFEACLNFLCNGLLKLHYFTVLWTCKVPNLWLRLSDGRISSDNPETEDELAEFDSKPSDVSEISAINKFSFISDISPDYCYTLLYLFDFLYICCLKTWLLMFDFCLNLPFNVGYYFLVGFSKGVF